MDANRDSYILLTPKRDGLERRAISLPSDLTLIAAENLAARFNLGDLSGFRTAPGQILTGSEIPTLYAAEGGIWLQSVTPFGTGDVTVQDGLFHRVMVETAINRGVNRNVALLTRDEDFERTYLLLTPAAAALSPKLPGDWAEVSDHAAHRWGILYSNGVTVEELGLRPMRD